MVKKILLLSLLSAVIFSGCGKEIPVAESAPSETPIIAIEETVSNDTTEDIVVEAISEPEIYTNLGITSGTVSSKINFFFSASSEYSFETEQYSIKVILNEGLSETYTQQCVIYTFPDSDEVLCVRFMDTSAVLVQNDSGSKVINNCIDSVISLLDIPESGYIAKTYNDENYAFSFYIYPVDVDLTVLLQPKTFDIPTESASDIPQDTLPSNGTTASTDATPIPSSDAGNDTVEVTTGQRNALKQAKQYLNVAHFSYLGLIEQLEFEGYTYEEAVYAADNCGADWNEQALQKANDYLSTSPFSYSSLISQLKFENFTNEQATYAADNCGADWNEQAANKAATYLSIMTFSRESLISQLEFEGFTHDQAVYGAEANGY